jgi:hypothetical protein
MRVKTIVILCHTLLGAPVIHAAQATISWTINAPAATDTAVERRQETAPAVPYAEIAAPKAPTSTYIDTGLTVGAIYCYRIRSRTQSTSSAYTGEVCILATPTGVTLIYTP